MSEDLKFYVPAQLVPVVGYWGNPERFAGNESASVIKQQIETVLDTKAPVNREVLCKRVLAAWGISRMGARINRRFDGLLSATHVKSTKPGDSAFYWNVEMEPQQYDDFRVPSLDDKSRRSLEHIPPEEIASAIKFILTKQLGLSKEDLEREVLEPD